MLFCYPATAAMTLNIAIDEPTKVLADAILRAQRYNVDLRDLGAGHDLEGDQHASIYIARNLQYLLHQRDKIDLALLDEILPPDVKEAWTNLLETLREQNRGVLNISDGSIVFEMFCPTKVAEDQLQDPKWIEQFRDRFFELIRCLGM